MSNNPNPIIRRKVKKKYLASIARKPTQEGKRILSSELMLLTKKPYAWFVRGFWRGNE